MEDNRKSIREYIDEDHIKLLDVKESTVKHSFRKKLIGVAACFLFVIMILNANNIYVVAKELFYYVFNGSIVKENEIKDYYVLEKPIIKENYTIEAFYKYKDTVYYRIECKQSFDIGRIDLTSKGKNLVGDSISSTSVSIESMECVENSVVQSENGDSLDNYTTREGYYTNIKNTKDFSLHINEEEIKIDLVKPSPITNMMTFDGPGYTINFIPLASDYKNFILSIEGFKKYDHIEYELAGIYLIDEKGKEHLAVRKGTWTSEYELLEPTDAEIVGIKGGKLRKGFPTSFKNGIDIKLPNPKSKGTIKLDKVVEVEGLPDINILEISKNISDIPEDLIETRENSKGKEGLKITYFIENGDIGISSRWSNCGSGYPIEDKRAEIIYVGEGLPNEEELDFNIYYIHTTKELEFNMELPSMK